MRTSQLGERGGREGGEVRLRKGEGRVKRGEVGE